MSDRQEKPWPWNESEQNVTMALVSAKDICLESFGTGNVNPGLVTRIAEMVLKEVDTLCRREMIDEETDEA